MKDELDYTSQYSEVIEIGNELYLASSMYSGTEESYLVMHQEMEDLLECQVEELYDEVKREELKE